MYGAIAVSASVLFFFLHHLGNQLPYEVAKQRFETAFKEGNLPSSAVTYAPPGSVTSLAGVSKRLQCQTSLLILRGARKSTDGAAPFLDAVLPKTFEYERDLCKTLKAVVVDNAQLDDRLEKTRYWWGDKALRAVALRWFSVFEIREMTKTLTYFVYLLLAVFLIRFCPGGLLLFSPWIFLGFFFSMVPYMSGSAHGLAYLWAVLSAAGLVWLTGRGVSPPSSPRALRVFCFIAGTVSSYLWDLDFHTSFTMVFIGLFVYFSSGKVRPAVLCIALYIAGFLACFMLGQLAKIAAYEWLISDPNLWSRFYGGKPAYESGLVVKNLLDEGILYRGGAIFGELGSRSTWLHPDFLFKYELWRGFVDYGMGRHSRVAEIFAYCSVFALIGSAALAAVQARRGRPRSLHGVTFIIGMIFLMWLEFTLPSDNLLKAGRYMFIPHALCWMSLILVIMNRRHCGNIGATGGATCIRGSKAWPGGGKYGAA